MEYIFLVLGFFALIKGADLFVDGASNIAKLCKIPKVIVGLTIVSIGTSLPEASVSITSGLMGSNEIGFGNIIGSNIFNTAMVLGLCSLIKPIKTNKSIMKSEYPLMFFVSVLTLVLMLDGDISRYDATILVLLFVYFIGNSVIKAIKTNVIEKDDGKKVNLLLSLVFLVVGGGLIIVGGDAVVASAKTIAETFGMSDAVIGLTVVAIGTSLPELVTSLVASKKGESDIALGNVVGSNMFNLLFILGTSSVITPIVLDEFAIIDMSVFVGMLIFAYIVFASKKIMNRLPALMLVLAYVGFNAYLLVR